MKKLIKIVTFLCTINVVAMEVDQKSETETLVGNSFHKDKNNEIYKKSLDHIKTTQDQINATSENILFKLKWLLDHTEEIKKKIEQT